MFIKYILFRNQEFLLLFLTILLAFRDIHIYICGGQISTFRAFTCKQGFLVTDLIEIDFVIASRARLRVDASPTPHTLLGYAGRLSRPLPPSSRRPTATANAFLRTSVRAATVSL